ncbi:helix-turn-helix domain-containing protein [Microbacterium sp. SSM24]|uniref:helix-turn-helix domain-containing protein n=1 Tax=Microbacterium sp. SSM24 TaxID=2991714 RepID=UPI002227A6CD|nr:helix-turn-helix transcriptional regulator [Microbacterium sp. SSM24]MCW3493607.1 helix-turn-helix domain-containing protein [Microbacterium sp. SSM24]
MSEKSGTVLRALRERTGLTAREVARRARVSESYLSRVESGKANPSDAWLGFVASVLSDALIEQSTERTSAPKADDTP